MEDRIAKVEKMGREENKLRKKTGDGTRGKDEAQEERVEDKSK